MVVGPAATVGSGDGGALELVGTDGAVPSGVFETVESLDPHPADVTTTNDAATTGTHFTTGPTHFTTGHATPGSAWAAPSGEEVGLRTRRLPTR